MKPLALIAAIALAAPSFAHEAPSGWLYDPWCCNNKDCTPVGNATVELTPEGYLVTLDPETHDLAQSRIQRLFRYPDADPSNDRLEPPEAMRSGDSKYHACVSRPAAHYNMQQNIRCFYAPEMGS